MKRIFLTLLTTCLLISCNEKGHLSEGTARQLIEEHLQSNLPHQTTNFMLGERKFRTQKDSEEIDKIRNLQKENYLELDSIKTKKRWFSSDSTIVINIRLTEKSLPYVTELKETRAKIKTIEYQLITNKDITIEQKTDTRANAKAILRKMKTPFYIFGKDTDSQDFIIQEFKFKFSDANGWELIK